MSAESLQIVLEETCGTCDGAGVVASEAWQAYLRRWNEIEKIAEQEARSLSRGEILEQIERRLELEDLVEPTEPEEPLCPSCDGRRFEPTPAGAAILAFVRRYGA